MPRIVIVSGEGAGKEFEIADAVILGRLDSNDVPIHDRKASREHAKIYRQGQQFAVVDLNSSNGTFVNDERITKRILKPGDEIAIGMVRLRFEDPDAERAREQAAGQRKTADQVLAAPPERKPASEEAAQREVVLRGHQPLQFARVKPGRSLLGFDLDQVSDTGRMILWLVLIGLFVAIFVVSFGLAAG